MRQSVPWSVKGVGADAREAAKEFARRSGMTLGEWLNAMIADQAAPAIEDELSPIEAMARRIEELNRRASDTTPMPPPLSAGRLRASEEQTVSIFETLMRRSEETEARTARWMETLAKANRDTEMKAANALAAVARWIETAEKHERSRPEEVPKPAPDRQSVEAIRMVMQRLDQIEAKLPQLDNAVAKPLQTSIGRLEARLSALAEETRSAHAAPSGFARTASDLDRRLADVVDKLDSMQTERNAPRPDERIEHISRIEDKLARILDTLSNPRDGEQPAAKAPSRQAPVFGSDRGSADLGEAIQQIHTRQRVLDKTPTGRGARRTFLPNDWDRDADQAGALGGIRDQIATLTGQIEGLRRSNTGRAGDTDMGSEIAALRREVAALARGVAVLAPMRNIEALERQIASLSDKIDEARRSGASEHAIMPIEDGLSGVASMVSGLVRTDIAGVEQELAAVSRKLDLVGAQGVDATTFAQLQRQTDEIRHLVERFAAPGAFDEINERIAHLGERLDHVPRFDADNMFARLEARLEALDSKLDRAAAPRIALPDLDDLNERIDQVHAAIEKTRKGANTPDMDRLVGSLDAVRDRMDRALAAGAAAPAASTASLEGMIRQLADKLETAQRPDADAGALDALERQVARLAEKIDSTAQPARDLTAIERSLGDIFLQLESTRRAAEASVEDAATRAFDRGAAPSSTDDMRREIEDLRAAQERADRRTQSSLDTLHGLLETVAGRLDPTDVRPAPAVDRREAPRPYPPRPDQGTRPGQPTSSPRAPIAADLPDDFPLEPGQAAAPRSPPATATQPDANAVTRDMRAQHIEQARRAAKAAQEAAGSMPAKGKPAAATKSDAVKSGAVKVEEQDRFASTPSKVFGQAGSASPVDKAREFYARRKRPVLLGLAAVMLALGTIQVVKLTSPNGNDGTQSDIVPQARPTTLDTDRNAPPVLQAPVPTNPTVASPAPAEPAPPLPANPPAAPKPHAELSTGMSRSLAEAALTPHSAPPSSPALAVPSLSSTMVQQDPPPAPEATASIAPAAPSGPPPAALTAAASAGDPRAMFDLATRMADAATDDTGLKSAADLYQRAATKGFAPAQYRLGSMYEKGFGVTKDILIAKGWYERAAGKGNVKSMHNLAVLYAEGAIGGKPDYVSAAQWFHRAAEYGLRDSEYNYAILVARGLGGKTDLGEAYKWLQLAAAQGDADAGQKSEDVAKHLDGPTLIKAKAAIAAFNPVDAPVMSNEGTLPPVAWNADRKPVTGA